MESGRYQGVKEAIVPFAMNITPKKAYKKRHRILYLSGKSDDES
jgi:hypothetical protein